MILVGANNQQRWWCKMHLCNRRGRRDVDDDNEEEKVEEEK